MYIYLFILYLLLHEADYVYYSDTLGLLICSVRVSASFHQFIIYTLHVTCQLGIVLPTV